MIGLTHYLLLSAVLFSIGLYGVLSKRNVIAVLMSLEILFNAVTVAVVALAKYTLPKVVEPGTLGSTLLTGQVFAIFVITVAAAEIVLGLALVIAIYRNRETVDVSQINLMRR